MGNQKNLIELNGQKYDTVTGKVMTSGSPHTPKKNHATSHAGGSVEGFVAPRTGKAHHSGPSAKGMHHKTTKSKTLMRGAVHRPAISALQDTIGHIAQVESNTHVVADHKRAQRAKKVYKSSLISRFSSGNSNASLTTKTAVLPVKPAPAVARASVAHTAATVSPKQSFAKELENAQSHTQPKAPKRKLHHRVAKKLHLKPHILSIVASSAVVVLLIGFFTYQYRAYASVRLAAARSGVHATLPAQPAGFSLSDKVAYKPGEVNLAYESNSDNRNFTVTQASSSWNSEALEENFIAQLPPPHSSTLYPSGKTVFTYGTDGNNATWVSGGVWYKVEGNSALTSTQLQSIINSM